MNFFTSSIIAVTLSSLMFLKVEGMEIQCRIVDDSCKPNPPDDWLLGQAFNTKEERYVYHPDAPKLWLHTWNDPETGLVHLENTTGARFKYKVRDDTSGLWSEVITSEAGTEHTMRVKIADIWFKIS